MIKQSDARREVTAADLQTIDAAISSNEALGGYLYRSRYILGEISKLEQHYRGLKEAIAVVERQGEQANAHLEAANTRLAEVQQQEVEVRKQVAALQLRTPRPRPSTRPSLESSSSSSAHSMICSGNTRTSVCNSAGSMLTSIAAVPSCSVSKLQSHKRNRKLSDDQERRRTRRVESPRCRA